LIDNKDRSTTFVHSENFNGLLVRPFKQKLLTETKQGFQEMNERLKEVVENKVKLTNYTRLKKEH